MPRWRESLARTRRNPWRRIMSIVAMPCLALALIMLYTHDRTWHLLRGEGQRVQFVYANNNARSTEQPLLLGTTSDWVSVYWPERRRAEAISQQSLQSLIYPPVRINPDVPR